VTWYIDRRAGLKAMPWRVLPALPLFVISTLLFEVIVTPVMVLVLLAHSLYSSFVKG
jgi:hypothetical protein